jgi:hypothetical protein
MFVSFHDLDHDAAGHVPGRQITVRRAWLSRGNETVFNFVPGFLILRLAHKLLMKVSIKQNYINIYYSSFVSRSF